MPQPCSSACRRLIGKSVAHRRQLPGPGARPLQGQGGGGRGGGLTRALTFPLANVSFSHASRWLCTRQHCNSELLHSLSERLLQSLWAGERQGCSARGLRGAAACPLTRALPRAAHGGPGLQAGDGGDRGRGRLVARDRRPQGDRVRVLRVERAHCRAGMEVKGPMSDAR